MQRWVMTDQSYFGKGSCQFKYRSPTQGVLLHTRVEMILVLLHMARTKKQRPGLSFLHLWQPGRCILGNENQSIMQSKTEARKLISN